MTSSTPNLIQLLSLHKIFPFSSRKRMNYAIFFTQACLIPFILVIR